MKYNFRLPIGIVLGLFVCLLTSTTVIAQTTTLDIKVYLQGYWNGATHSKVPVSVEVRSGGITPNSSVLVERQTGIMNTNGTIQLPFASLSTSSYWIIVRCGGRIPVSSTLQTVTAGGTFSYNFTDALNKSYSSNSVRQVGGEFVVRSGDLDGGQSINAVDVFTYFVPNNGISVFSIIPPP